MSTITLTDAAGTPVNRAFVGTQSTPDLAIWKDFTTNSGYPVGAGAASVSVKENANGTTRISCKLVLPTLESVAGDDASGFTPQPTKAFECLGTFEFVLPSRASLQNRKDLRAMLLDFIGDAVITSAVENFVHPTA
jgi:hypothetical protein